MWPCIAEQSLTPLMFCLLTGREKGDASEGVNEIHEFWDGKVTSAMEAEWRSLGYSMLQSYPPVKAMHMHFEVEKPQQTEAAQGDDENSEFTEYLRVAPRSGKPLLRN